MRFLLGLAIGFGVGFGGALLLAPDRSKWRSNDSGAASIDEEPLAFEDDHNVIAVVKRATRSARELLNEAMDEAKRAQEETEREMRRRYEIEVRRVAEAAKEGPDKSKGKEKYVK
jgi:gas vesicle protein